MKRSLLFTAALLCGMTPAIVAAAPNFVDAELASQTAAPGQNAPPSRRHFQALEGLPLVPLDEAVRRLEADHLSPAYMAETTADQRRQTIETLRGAVAGAGGVMVRGQQGLFTLELRGGRQEADIQFRMDDAGRIRTLELRPLQEAVVQLTPETLASAFDKWAAEGLSGGVFIQRGGAVLLDQSYGTANADLGTKPTADTVFGIGSTPISFTVAAIDLLATRGVISLDDPVSKYYDMPADKASLTIRHLMSGRSGLPDFVHTTHDWNPDLAWVDRDTVVARIAHAPLRFAPGESRAHSHAAFGLLAAVIEKVSGQTYYDFIRQNILDPAGMERTGLYGETRGLKLSDFAVGSGPRLVGLPNIPPNWGPTSWLIMGSGGMVSTLNDMRKFFDYVEATPAFGPDSTRRARSPGVEIGGSTGGYFFYRARNGQGDVAMMLLNTDGRTRQTQGVTRALNKFILGEDTN